MGISPLRKYQSDGGPGCAELGEAIWTHSGEPGEDVWTFARAIMLNWIIGGTDAHARNFSLLIGASGRARLAPLYDMASTLPYDFDPGKLKMAIRIGGEYLFDAIFPHHWGKFATELRLPPADVIGMGRTIAETLPVALARTVDAARRNGLDHPILQRLVEKLNARSQRCARILAAATA